MALLCSCSDGVVSPPSPQSVSVAFCDALAPLWLAFQDGDGAWTRVEPAHAGGSRVFQFAVASNRGGVATVFQGAPGSTFLQVLYGTPEELATGGITIPRFCETAALRKLVGTVAGLDANELAIIRGSNSVVVAHVGEEFTLDFLPPGPKDILAARETFDGESQRLTKFILRRGVDLPDDASLPVLDFDAPEAFAPVLPSVTLEGTAQDGAFILSQLRTGSIETQFSIPIPGADGPVRQYYALPEAQLEAGDLQELVASAHGGTPNASRSVVVYFRSPVDRTLTFGPDVIPPAFSTLATTPALRLRARFVPQGAYDREASVAYSGAGPASMAVSMTAAYAALQDGYDLITPDLLGVAGFDPAWAMSNAATVLWSANRIGGTLGLGIDAVPADGATRRAAYATDVLTP